MRQTRRVALGKLRRRQPKSGVHGSLMLGRTQGGGEYSPRWSLLCLCRILMYELDYVWTSVCIRCGLVRVVLEYSLSLLSYIMSGAPHVVTYSDLIAANTQGEPVACPATKAAGAAVSMGRSVCSHAPQSRRVRRTALTKSRYRHRDVIVCPR